LPAYSASAKVICFMEKLGWRDRRISPDSGSLFQTFLSSRGVLQDVNGNRLRGSDATTIHKRR